ncbi:MAG: hypothetical protein WCG48_00020 [Candidatus Berkelbacteria bacterium]
MDSEKSKFKMSWESIKSKFLELTPKTKLLIGLGIFLLVVLVASGILAKSKMSSLANNTGEIAAGNIIADGKCSLPQQEIKESAFTIGVPAGWLYELNNGTVSIMKDTSNLEGAFLYTAKLTKEDISAKEFLTASSGFFTKSVAAEGGTFTVTNIKEIDGDAEGTIVASLNNTPIAGVYKVEKEGNFVTLRAYYAPEKDIETSRNNLKEVVGCFSRTTTLTTDILTAIKAKEEVAKATPSGFTKYTGKYFSLSLPSGYKVTGESDSGIDISRNDMSAGFSYAYVTGAKGPYTSESWTSYALPKFASIGNLSLGSGQNVPSEIAGMKVQEFPFTGVLSGTTNVKGKVTTGVINTTDFGMGSSTSAFWAIQVAKPEVFGSVSSILQTIQDSVTIIDIGDIRKKAMLPPNRPIESSGSSIPSKNPGASVSDESSNDWADAMHGYQTMESPTTGEKFDVPLNSWNETGPDGPGQYIKLPNGDTQKLQEVE